MSTVENNLATLRTMKNSGELCAEDAAALDMVDRMLRELNALRSVESAKEHGLIDQARRDEMVAKMVTFSGVSRSSPSECRCVGAVMLATAEAERIGVPLILTPRRLPGAHVSTWTASISGQSRSGYTVGDACNELAMRLRR